MDKRVFLARIALSGRRERDAIFGSGLFGEPAWDMMLDLYVAHYENRPVSISSLCIAACVPPTTAMRCIDKLVKMGWFVRQRSGSYARRVDISASDMLIRHMDALVDASLVDKTDLSSQKIRVSDEEIALLQAQRNTAIKKDD